MKNFNVIFYINLFILIALGLSPVLWIGLWLQIAANLFLTLILWKRNYGELSKILLLNAVLVSVIGYSACKSFEEEPISIYFAEAKINNIKYEGSNGGCQMFLNQPWAEGAKYALNMYVYPSSNGNPVSSIVFLATPDNALQVKKYSLTPKKSGEWVTAYYFPEALNKDVYFEVISGNLEIKQNTSDMFIEGIFNFTAKNPNTQEQITISNGKFEVSLCDLGL